MTDTPTLSRDEIAELARQLNGYAYDFEKVGLKNKSAHYLEVVAQGQVEIDMATVMRTAAALLSAASRSDTGAQKAVSRELFKALQAMAEGYPVTCSDDRFIVVDNPDFREDNGSSPRLVIDVHALSAASDTGAQIVNRLMELVDQSNWPEELSQLEFRGYRAAMEIVEQLILDYQEGAYNEAGDKTKALEQRVRELEEAAGVLRIGKERLEFDLEDARTERDRAFVRTETAERERDALREALSRANQCLGFFASVIKSGEPWTEVCEREYEKARALTPTAAPPAEYDDAEKEMIRQQLKTASEEARLVVKQHGVTVHPRLAEPVRAFKDTFSAATVVKEHFFPESPPEDKCAQCGYPRREHSYNGACYGVCGKFVPPTGQETHSPAPQDEKEVG